MNRILTLILFALWFLASPLVAAAHKEASPPNPHATWATSAAAIRAVNRVHAEGTLQVHTKGAPLHIALSSDADWSGQKGLLRFHYEVPDTSTYQDIITIGTDAWVRASETGGQWVQTYAGPESMPVLYALLPDIVLQPQAVAGPTKVNTKQLVMVGADTVGGKSVWHLRLRWKDKTTTVRVNVYVDQTSGLWLRKTTRLVASSKSGSFVMAIDTSYSRFNEAVSISPPDLSQVPPGATPKFWRPGGVAIAPDGTVVVADGGMSRVVRLSPEGRLVGIIPLDLHDQMQSTEPADVAVDGEGNIYVVFWLQDRMLKLDANGKLIDTIQTGKNSIWGAASTVALDAAGNVWVGYMDGRVHEYSPDGRLLLSWQRPGDFSGSSDATDLAIAGDGTMYFTDTRHGSGARRGAIQVFSPSGKLLQTWAGRGAAPGQFNLPTDVAVDRVGDVYVTDIGNGRVQKLSPDGKPLAAWPAGPFADEDAANGIAVDQSGNVYVSGAYQVQKFGPDGRLLASWGGN